MSDTIRQKLYDLKAERAGYISAAEAALEAGSQEEYRANIDKAKGLNEKLDELQADLAEAERYDSLAAPGAVPQMGAQRAQGSAVKTVDDLKGMSTAEINKRWAEIMAQMSE